MITEAWYYNMRVNMETGFETLLVITDGEGDNREKHLQDVLLFLRAWRNEAQITAFAQKIYELVLL